MDCMQIVEDSSRWSTPKTASKGGPFSFVFKSLRWIQTARTSHIHIALEPFRFRLRRTSVLRHSVDSNDDSVSCMVNFAHDIRFGLQTRRSSSGMQKHARLRDFLPWSQGSRLARNVSDFQNHIFPSDSCGVERGFV